MEGGYGLSLVTTLPAHPHVYIIDTKLGLLRVLQSSRGLGRVVIANGVLGLLMVRPVLPRVSRRCSSQGNKGIPQESRTSSECWTSMLSYLSTG